MPRFYFDVSKGAQFTHDDDRQEFPDADAAEHEAARAAAEIGRDALLKEDSRKLTIEVRNEHRQRIITVTVAISVERVDLPIIEPQTMPDEPDLDLEMEAFVRQGRGVQEVLQSVEDALLDAGYDDFRRGDPTRHC